MFKLSSTKYLLALVVLLGAGCSTSITVPPAPTSTPEPVSCTMEAKLCPDGSYVARTGPNCDFTPCPTVHPVTPPPPTPTTQSSGIEGTTSFGPTCPVERIPPDPNCAPRPYQATITVQTESGQTVTQFTTNSDGTFKVALAPGNYLLVPVSKNIYPRGQTESVTVEKNKFTKVIISFDSGIR